VCKKVSKFAKMTIVQLKHNMSFNFNASEPQSVLVYFTHRILPQGTAETGARNLCKLYIIKNSSFVTHYLGDPGLKDLMASLLPSSGVEASH
jgi:hypothetical protein